MLLEVRDPWHANQEWKAARNEAPFYSVRTVSSLEGNSLVTPRQPRPPRAPMQFGTRTVPLTFLHLPDVTNSTTSISRAAHDLHSYNKAQTREPTQDCIRIHIVLITDTHQPQSEAVICGLQSARANGNRSQPVSFVNCKKSTCAHSRVDYVELVRHSLRTKARIAAIFVLVGQTPHIDLPRYPAV